MSNTPVPEDVLLTALLSVEPLIFVNPSTFVCAEGVTTNLLYTDSCGTSVCDAAII